MAKQMWKAGNMLYPLPAVMVSCKREGEKPNIITVAWAGTICTNPAMVSISIRKERYSYDIIKDSGRFVINLVNEELVRQADWCGVRSGRDYDKFKEMNLTAREGSDPSMVLIGESPVNIECEVTEIKELGSHDMFIAKVINVWADEKYMDENGKFELNNSGLVTYSHGEYFLLGKKLGKFGYSVKKDGKKHQKSTVKVSQNKTDKTQRSHQQASHNNADKTQRSHQQASHNNAGKTQRPHQQASHNKTGRIKKSTSKVYRDSKR